LVLTFSFISTAVKGAPAYTPVYSGTYYSESAIFNYHSSTEAMQAYWIDTDGSVSENSRRVYNNLTKYAIAVISVVVQSRGTISFGGTLSIISQVYINDNGGNGEFPISVRVHLFPSHANGS
jgi:hypothetical protein